MYMKKMLLTIVALLVSWLVANAQLNFGIKAGYNSSLNLANLSSVTSGDYVLDNLKGEISNGFQIGAFARIGKKLYIQPELLYAAQKTEYSLTVEDVMNSNAVETGTKFVKLSTVDIPVLIGYKILDLDVVNLRAYAGPKFRLNAGSSLEWENISTTNISKLEGDFKKSNIGLEAGVGVDVFMFTIDARLNMINDLYQADWQTKPDLNSNFVISVGWKLF